MAGGVTPELPGLDGHVPSRIACSICGGRYLPDEDHECEPSTIVRAPRPASGVPARGPRKPRSGPRESAIQDAIRRVLGAEDLRGEVVLWRNNVGTGERRGHFIRFGVGGPGGADLIGVYRSRAGAGVFLAVEIKSATGRQSEEQVRFANLVRSLGGEYAVLRSVDDARAWLAELRRRYG